MQGMALINAVYDHCLSARADPCYPLMLSLLRHCCKPYIMLVVCTLCGYHGTVRLVIFVGLNFRGLRSSDNFVCFIFVGLNFRGMRSDNFVGLYFCGIPTLVA